MQENVAIGWPPDWVWTALKENTRNLFGRQISRFYNSDTIQGYIDKGWADGLWTLRAEKNGPIVETTIFIS